MKRQLLTYKAASIVFFSIMLLFSGSLMAQFPDSLALFVVADANAPNAAESLIISELESMQFTVEMIGQNDVSDGSADGTSLVLISATVSSGTVGGNMPNLIDLPIPIIIWEPFLYDALGFEAADGGEFNTTMIEIVDADHPLAAGLPADYITITNAADPGKGVSYGMPEGDVDVIAVNVDDETQVVLFGYEKGAAMAVGTAPARRVGTFLLNDVADENMTEDGWMLFDASVKWAMNYLDSDTTTAVRKDAKILPADCVLQNNYPNPFNPATHIGFSIPAQTHVRLSVWNSLGEEIATLVDETKPAGDYTVRFDASDLPSGLYFYRLDAGAQTRTQKMVLMK
ncbi:MAG: T9SS type A sorting domain-containing protein [Deltaproteobacteria bacterium]|nr:T9SS type A sorting domain-containing protein [Deltaproteobacteria bacterium]